MNLPKMTALCLLWVASSAFGVSPDRAAAKVGFQDLGTRGIDQGPVAVLPVAIQWVERGYWTPGHPAESSPNPLFSQVVESELNPRLEARLYERLGAWELQPKKKEQTFSIREGRIATPAMLAAPEAAPDSLSLAVSVVFQQCQTPSGWVPCIRGEDRAYGWGTPGFSMVFGEGVRVGKRGPRPKRLYAVVKRWTYARQGLAEYDAPLLPRVQGSVEDQLVDLFDQALEHSWSVTHRKAARKAWRSRKP